MSLLALNLVPADAPLAPAGWSGSSPDGVVCTMEQAIVGRWFAVDVLMIPATRPIDVGERVIAALSRAAGPVGLALVLLAPIAAGLR